MRKQVLLLADMEGIIGVSDMRKMSQNILLAYKEIEIVTAELKKAGFEDITVCNIHDNGTCLSPSEIEKRGFRLIQGMECLVEEISKFDVAVMIGFHGKNNSGGRFDHTFRFDFQEVLYGKQDIGEVGAYFRWLSLEDIPVIMISGEGNFADEVNQYECVIHKIENFLVSEYEYERLKEAVREAVLGLKDENALLFQIPLEEVYVKINNSEKSFVLHREFPEFQFQNPYFFFADLKDFFEHIYPFVYALNRADKLIYWSNVDFVQAVKEKLKTSSKEEIEQLLGEYLKKDIMQISALDRKYIAEKLEIDYEDFISRK